MKLLKRITKLVFFRTFTFGLLVLTISCKKDAPTCNNCQPPVHNDTTVVNTDIRAKYIGKFNIKYRYYSRHYSMSQGIFLITDTTFSTTLIVSYPPTDSLISCWHKDAGTTCESMPALLLKISPNKFPGLRYEKLGILNDNLFDGTPYCNGGFVNKDSISFKWRDDDWGTRDGERREITGSRK